MRGKGRGPPPVKASYWPRQATTKTATPSALPLGHFFRTQKSSALDVKISDPATAHDTSAHNARDAHVVDPTNLRADAEDLELTAKVLEGSDSSPGRRLYQRDEGADPSTASVSDDSDRALELSLDRPPLAPPYQFPTPQSAVQKGKAAPGTSLDGPKTPAAGSSVAASGPSSGKPANSSASKSSASRTSHKVDWSSSRGANGSVAPPILPLAASLSRVDSASVAADTPPPPSSRRLSQKSHSQASASKLPNKRTGRAKASAPTKNGFLLREQPSTILE